MPIKRPDATIRALSVDLLPRNDVLNRLGNAISTYQAIPGLRGFWPMSAVGTSGLATDQSGQNRDLTNNNTATFGYDSLIPYCEYVAANLEYHFRNDEAGLDIIGNEAFIASTFRGLGMGLWANFTDASGGTEDIIGKWDDTGNQRAYSILRTGSDTIRFRISTDGSVSTPNVTTTATVAVDTWYYIAVFYNPSTEISITLRGTDINETASNTTSIPATLFNSSASFAIAARSGGSNFSDMKASLAWLSTEYVGQSVIDALWSQTASIFDAV